MEDDTINTADETSDKLRQTLKELLNDIPDQEFADFLIALDTVVNTIKEVRLRQSMIR